MAEYEIGGEIELADGSKGTILDVGEGTAKVKVISPSGAVSNVYVRIGKAAAAKATAAAADQATAGAGDGVADAEETGADEAAPKPRSKKKSKSKK